MEHVGSLDAVRSFLVAVDGSPAAMHALTAACEIARRTRATVAALYVIEVPRALPVEAEMPAAFERGEAILAQAEAVGRVLDVPVDGRILQARTAGVAVVDEAAALGADAIVIGLDYHRTYGKFELGQVPLYVLGNAQALVWIIRYPTADEPS